MNRRILYIFLIAVCAIAISCGKKAPSLDSKECEKAEGYFFLGVSFMNNDDPTTALEELLKAEKLCPNDPRIHNAMGLVYYAKERFDKAILHFQKALLLDPEDSDAAHNLAIVYLYLNRYDEAIALLLGALESDVYRNQANSLNAVGWAYYKKNDYIKAEEFFRKTLEHDRMYLPAYDNLAKVYISLSRFKDAETELVRALNLNEFFIEARLDLGIVYLKSSQQAQACEQFSKVLGIDPLGKLGAQAQEFINLLECEDGRSYP